MKAVVYSKPKNFKIKDIPIPMLDDNQVLVQIKSCGVCKTDVHIHNGEFIAKFPLTPGHEFSGIVEKTGKEVRNLLKGDRVTIDNTILCGYCYYCKNNLPRFCENFRSLGITDQGGFAEYIVANFEKAYKISEFLSFDEASFSEPIACAIHGIDVVTPKIGNDILIFGAGPTGIIIAQLLKYGGASRIIMAAPTKFKLEIANEICGIETVQIEKSNSLSSEEKIRELCPKGFDIIIDATGAKSIVQNLVIFAKKGAKILIYGVCNKEDVINYSPYEIFEKELKIFGSWVQTHNFGRAVKYLENGIVKVNKLITHKFSLDKYSEALEVVTSGKNNLKILINP